MAEPDGIPKATQEVTLSDGVHQTLYSPVIAVMYVVYQARTAVCSF